MATATRASSFTPRYVGATENYIKDQIQDLVFNANVYMWLLKMKDRVKVGNWGHTDVVGLRQTRTAAAQTGRHLDTVTFSVPDGPQAAKFEYGEYRKGIAYSKSEQADNGGSGKQVDLIQERIDAELLTFAEQINTDLIQGNASDSLKMLGLMQALTPEDHITVNAELATRAQMRQAATTYGDITRVASAGTGWENVSVALDTTANNTGAAWTANVDHVFGIKANNEKTKSLKALDNVMQYGCTYGKIKPNVILSTPRPWLDYQHAFSQLVRFVGGDAKNEADLGVKYIMHNGCMWGVEEQLASTGLFADATTAGADMLAVLNTDFWNLKIEEGWYFDTSRDWSQFPDQVADGTILLFRGFHECINPRYNGILFNYGVA